MKRILQLLTIAALTIIMLPLRTAEVNAQYWLGAKWDHFFPIFDQISGPNALSINISTLGLVDSSDEVTVSFCDEYWTAYSVIEDVTREDVDSETLRLTFSTSYLRENEDGKYAILIEGDAYKTYLELYLTGYNTNITYYQEVSGYSYFFYTDQSTQVYQSGMFADRIEPFEGDPTSKMDEMMARMTSWYQGLNTGNAVPEFNPIETSFGSANQTNIDGTYELELITSHRITFNVDTNNQMDMYLYRNSQRTINLNSNLKEPYIVKEVFTLNSDTANGTYYYKVQKGDESSYEPNSVTLVTNASEADIKVVVSNHQATFSNVSALSYQYIRLSGYTGVMLNLTFGTVTTPFTDVDPNEYYYDAVIWAVDNGITSGTSKTTFSPEAECTRAQVATFLWRAAGEPEPTIEENPFTDVEDSGQMKPFYKAILWAYEQEITSGTTKTKFSPNATCTRAQIVTFLYRYAGSPTVTNATNPFTDVENSGAMKPFYTPILWAVQNGITSGTSTTKFSPNETCTRAQVVTFLYRSNAKG